MLSYPLFGGVLSTSPPSRSHYVSEKTNKRKSSDEITFRKGRSRNIDKRLRSIYWITSVARCWIRKRYRSKSQINFKLSTHMGRSRIRIPCVKQPEPAASTNDAEARSLFQATQRTLAYRSILKSLDTPQPHSTPTHEDNVATIAQVLNDRLTPRVKHIDVIIIWINNQFGRDRMVPVPCPSELEKGDMNTKQHGGSTLQQKFLPLVGFQFYPPPNSEHYKLLQLNEFEIGTHRGSFLLDKNKSPPKIVSALFKDAGP